MYRSPAQLREDTAIAGEIGFDRRCERFGPGHLDRLLRFRFGIRCRKLDPPVGPTENQRAIECKARKVAQAKGTGREQRDKQPITMNDSTGAGSTLTFRSRYQPETEVKQLSCRNQSVALWPNRPMPRADRRTNR